MNNAPVKSKRLKDVFLAQQKSEIQSMDEFSCPWCETLSHCSRLPTLNTLIKVKSLIKKN